MSRFHRTSLLVLTAGLVVTLALPASAGNEIRYRGETSQDRTLSLEVHKRNSGRRFAFLRIRVQTTCEDASTDFERWGIRLGRLDVGGSFDVSRRGDGYFDYWYHIAGTIGFRSAEGTFELRTASLTYEPDPQAQLCTSGELTWTAERVRAG
jgi:hypothetical protein